MPNIFNLDEDVEAVRALSLEALKAAARGQGELAPKARRAFAAYEASIAAGKTEKDAIGEAQAALSGRH